MANNVNITIGADASKAEGALKKFQANVRKAGLALSAMGAAGAFAIKGFTDAALRQNEAMALFLNSAENSGAAMAGLEEKVTSVTAALQRKTNFGDEEQLAVLAKMIPVLGSTEKAMAALPAIMDAAATTGRGLREQSETLTKALAGTVHQAESLGIKFDEAATFEERLAEITRLTGGAAEAAANPFIQLGNAVGDVSEQIGKALLPVVVPLVEKLKEFAEDLQKVNPQIIRWSAGILAAATAFGLLGGPFLLILSTVPKMIFGIKGLTLAFKKLGLAMLANPISIVIVGIIAAVGALAFAFNKNFLGIRDLVADVFQFVADFILGKINFIMKGVQSVIAVLPGIPSGVKKAVASFKPLEVDVKATFDNIGFSINDMVDGVKDQFQSLKDKFMDFVFTAEEGVDNSTDEFNTFANTVDKVANKVSDLGPTSDKAFTAMAESAEDAQKRIQGAMASFLGDIGGKAGMSSKTVGPGASFFQGLTGQALIEAVNQVNLELQRGRRTVGMTETQKLGFAGGSDMEFSGGKEVPIGGNQVIINLNAEADLQAAIDDEDALADKLGNALIGSAANSSG